MTARTITLKDGREVEVTVSFDRMLHAAIPCLALAWALDTGKMIDGASGPTEADAIAALKRKLEGDHG
jgi:hypothetical protein